MMNISLCNRILQMKSAMAFVRRCFVAALVLSPVLMTVTMPQVKASGPIVVLEYAYDKDDASGYDGTHPFRLDPDYSVKHRVRMNETLSHIMANYYNGSGLNHSFVEMAIVKKNRRAFVRGNPHYLYADVVLHLPSVNEITAMITGENSSSDSTAPSSGGQDEIYFFGN